MAEEQKQEQGFMPSVQSWFAQPQNKAALLQFGLALMQPPQWGQGPGAQIASAIGEGAEAQQRNVAGRAAAQQSAQELAIKQQEADASSVRARNSGGLSLGALFNAELKGDEKWGDFLEEALKNEAFTEDERGALINDNAWISKKQDEFAKIYPRYARRNGGGGGNGQPPAASGAPTGQAEAIAAAKAAIAKGAPRDAVIQRLTAGGYSAEGL